MPTVQVRTATVLARRSALLEHEAEVLLADLALNFDAFVGPSLVSDVLAKVTLGRIVTTRSRLAVTGEWSSAELGVTLFKSDLRLDILVLLFGCLNGRGGFLQVLRVHLRRLLFFFFNDHVIVLLWRRSLLLVFKLLL